MRQTWIGKVVKLDRKAARSLTRDIAMHMLIATLVGLITLGTMIGIAAIVSQRPDRSAIAAKIFLGLWLVASAIHFYRGVQAGYSVGEELVIHAVIFGVPALAAAYFIRKS